MTTVKMPEALEYWTADEVAECLNLPHDLYVKLWRFLGEATNRTPLGGDGSDGSVETPDLRLGLDNDDKAPHWWGKLSTDEQQTIATAFDVHEQAIQNAVGRKKQ